MQKTLTLIAALGFSLTAGLAQIKNIKLDEFPLQEQACEVSIAVNPKNLKHIVASSGAGKTYVTFDGGATWQKSALTSALGMGGNSLVLFTSKGDPYYFHLSDAAKNFEQIVCHTSKDGGISWDEGVGFGLNPSKSQSYVSVALDDKDNLYATWTQFDKLGSSDAGCMSAILMSKSSNGRKWSTPVVISQNPGDCSDGNGSVAGAMPAISLDGKIAISWMHQKKMFLDRSYDGNIWLTNDIAITLATAGRIQSVPGVGDIESLPTMVVDRSKVVTRGNLYLLWQDQRAGSKTVGVWLMKSTNFGDMWTSPTRVQPEDQEMADQYLPTMAVDQSSGIVYALYYNTNSESNQTNLYLAYSINGGHTFKSIKVNETPLESVSTTTPMRYNHLSAIKGMIVPTWLQFENGNASVWTAIITQDELLKDLPKDN
jgi:hypothetical protein